MDRSIFLRRPFWWVFLVVAALATGVAIWLLVLRGNEDVADAPNRSLPIASALPRGTEDVEPTPARDASAPLAISAFVRDCGRPRRARVEMEVDHLLELGCVGQLPVVLAALAERDSSPELHSRLAAHQERVRAVDGGDWTSPRQSRRMQAALVSAAEVMELMATGEGDSTRAVRSRVAEARQAALALRGELPLADQQSNTDDFFRRTSEAVQLLASRDR